jgi:hypothetical protein
MFPDMEGSGGWHCEYTSSIILINILAVIFVAKCIIYELVLGRMTNPRLIYSMAVYILLEIYCKHSELHFTISEPSG